MKTQKETFNFLVEPLKPFLSTATEKEPKAGDNPSGRVYVEVEMPTFTFSELAKINSERDAEVGETISRREASKLLKGLAALVTSSTDVSTPEAREAVLKMLANKAQEIVSGFTGVISVETPGRKNIAMNNARELVEQNKKNPGSVPVEKLMEALEQLTAK